MNMHRDILKIAVPSIVSNITVPLLGLVDVAITGHLGRTSYLGAIAVGGMLFNIIYWLFGFLRMGTSGLTAQAHGRGDGGEVRNTLVRSIAIGFGVSCLIMMLSPLVRELSLSLVCPEPEVAEYVRTYFDICVLGAAPSLCLFAINGWFIGMQNSRIPMFVAIAQNVMNIVFSLFFVYVLGMKVEGIAIGTVSAQWIGCLAAIMLARRYYGDVCRGLSLKGAFRRDELSRFFNVNRDIFLRTLCLISIHFFFIAAGARFGTVELAVNTLLMQLFTIYSYFMDGFAYAGEALCGKSCGEKSMAQYRHVRHSLFLWASAICLMFTVLYAVSGGGFLSILTDDDMVVSNAMSYRHWTLLFPVCSMAAFIWDGIYIGTTRTREMLISTFLGMLTFFSVYWLLAPRLHNDGLWIAFVTYLAVRGLVLTVTELRFSL